jgi:glucan phosphoethanolaminetransferase (alkaline phosphatase superfamily)
MIYQWIRNRTFFDRTFGLVNQDDSPERKKIVIFFNMSLLMAGLYSFLYLYKAFFIVIVLSGQCSSYLLFFLVLLCHLISSILLKKKNLFEIFPPVHVSFPVTSGKFCYFIGHLKGFSQTVFFSTSDFGYYDWFVSFRHRIS